MRTLFLIIITGLATQLFAQTNNHCKPFAFNKVQLYDGIEVTLERGDSNYVCTDTTVQLIDLSIEVADSTLRIRKITGQKYDTPPVLKIMFRELKSIEGYNKANIDVKNLISCDSISVVLKSGATLYAGFNVKYLSANLIEGCLFKADGYANVQQVDVNTMATFSGFKLEGIEGEVRAATGGQAKVNIEKKLKAIANSGGYIGYKGTPVLDEKTSLGGKIRHDAD